MKKNFTDIRFVIPAASFALLLLLLLLSYTMISVRAAIASRNELNAITGNAGSHDWHNEEIMGLKKEIHGYEQLLLMARNDSIGLLINLGDSTVQLNLKGLGLLQTKILRQYPPHFFASCNESAWMQFGTLATIVNENAGLPKKPIRKVLAYAADTKKTESLNHPADEKPLYWRFKTSSNLEVVITGVEASADSTYDINPRTDLLKYRIRELAANPVPLKYTPVVYLWLDNRDAIAIYRAVPSRGNVLFRY